MTISYALIDDVWGPPPTTGKQSKSKNVRPKRVDPSCQLIKKDLEKFDNIIDSYLHDPPCEEEAATEVKHIPMARRSFEYITHDVPSTNRSKTCGPLDVSGLEAGFSKDALQFDDFYANNTLFSSESPLKLHHNLKKSTRPRQEEVMQEAAPAADYSHEYVEEAEAEAEAEEEQQRGRVPEEEEEADYMYRTYAAPVQEQEHEHEYATVTVPTKTAVFDLSLYVFSGIFIIFLMEQILQLGIHLKV